MAEKQLDFRDLRKDVSGWRREVAENRHPIALLLDGITDPANLGLLFRLADAGRLEHLYLYRCPAKEPQEKTRRVSRQTVGYVPHSHLSEAELAHLKDRYLVVALEYTDQSRPLAELVPDRPVLLILGNARHGVSKQLLAWADHSTHIPMYGINTSMNVACAAGIAIYDLLAKLAGAR